MKYSDEKIRASLSGRFQIRECQFPGMPGIRLGIRILKDSEMDECRLQAVEYIKGKISKSKVDAAETKVLMEIDPLFYDRVFYREVVSRAFVDWEKKEEPFFSSMEEVAELDPHTVLALFELYGTFQQEADPYRYCGPEEVEKLVEAMGKSEILVALLNEFDAPTLRSLLLSTVRRLHEISRTPKSNTGGS